DADENRLGERMPARLALDIVAGRGLAQGQVVDRQREQPEVIVVRPVATRRAGSAIPGPMEVVDGLPEALALGLRGDAFRQRGAAGRDVVGCPMMPLAPRSIGI